MFGLVLGKVYLSQINSEFVGISEMSKTFMEKFQFLTSEFENVSAYFTYQKSDRCDCFKVFCNCFLLSLFKSMIGKPDFAKGSFKKQQDSS